MNGGFLSTNGNIEINNFQIIQSSYWQKSLFLHCINYLVTKKKITKLIKVEKNPL